jgi:hypothetical protein
MSHRLQQFLPFGRIIESKKSLEVYQHLSLESVDEAYQDAVQSVGIKRDFCGTLGTFVGLTP